MAETMPQPVATHLLDLERWPDFLERAEIEIEGDAHRHLFRSRRLATDAALRIVDGRGHARLGRVSSITKGSARVELGPALESNELRASIGLLVGAMKPERASWLVEKATELGASSIRFLTSERTPRKYGDGRLDRLRRVATAALEQCHRSALPEIEGVLPWQALAERMARADGLFLLHPGAPSLVSTAGSLEIEGSYEILVGPEGGFAKDEIAELSGLGARPVGLGPSILRVETAAIGALAILSSALGSRMGDP